MSLKLNKFSLVAAVLIGVIQFSPPSLANQCKSLFGRGSILDIDPRIKSDNQQLGGMSFVRLQENPRYALNQFLLLKLEEMSPREFIKKFYGDSNSVVVFANVVTGINPTWVKLLAYPGLIQRASNFTTFVYKNNYQHLTVDQVYQKFSEELGRKKIYRAVALPENTDITKLKNNPVLTKYLQDTADGKHGAPLPLDKQIITLGEDRNAHLQLRSLPQSLFARYNQNPDQFTLSVTEMPKIAIGITDGVILNNNLQHYQVYLFTFEIPDIELIGKDPWGLRGFYPLSQNTEAAPARIESFVVGGFSVDEIQDILLIDDQLRSYYDRIP